QYGHGLDRWTRVHPVLHGVHRNDFLARRGLRPRGFLNVPPPRLALRRGQGAALLCRHSLTSTLLSLISESWRVEPAKIASPGSRVATPCGSAARACIELPCAGCEATAATVKAFSGGEVDFDGVGERNLVEPGL